MHQNGDTWEMDADDRVTIGDIEITVMSNNLVRISAMRGVVIVHPRSDNSIAVDVARVKRKG